MNGQLAMDDLGIRKGETEWRRLRELFPDAALPALQQFSAGVAAPIVAGGPESPALYRNTLPLKILFGVCLLGMFLAFVGSAFYFWSLWGSSGDLMTDLGRMSYRVLARDMAIATFIATFFALLAFVMTFKRRIIQSGGVRIALRIFFIFVLLIGLIQFGYGAISYLSYSAPYKPANSKSNEMLKALEDGEETVGPLKGPTFFLPLSAGMMLFALSGILMTKRGPRENG